MGKKILERLNHLLGAVVSRKQARQNRRLYSRTYPWLWAIRNIWHPAVMTITVSRDETNLSKLLVKAVSEQTFKELWVRTLFGDLEVIIKVEPRRDHDYHRSWASRILDEVPEGYLLKNIVIVTMPEEGKEEFSIYLPPRRQKSLSELVQLAVRLPTETPISLRQ